MFSGFDFSAFCGAFVLSSNFKIIGLRRFCLSRVLFFYFAF